MAREKSPPKYRWFCRHCSKHQNRRAPANPTPVCDSCGRTMETADVVAPEVKTAAEMVVIARDAAVPAATSAPAGASSEAMAVKALIDIRRRLDAMEMRLKSPQTVLDELRGALLALNRRQLEDLASLLEEHAVQAARAARAIREGLTN